MTPTFVIGYDPGGNVAHGVAALRVRADGAHWQPLDLQTETAHTLKDVVAWLESSCRDGRIVAAGVDTLTEWNTGPCGWRPADRWLRDRYPKVKKRVVSPNSIYGSMALNGAAFLTMLTRRFHADSTLVTEAHPKVSYFALTGRTPSWRTDSVEMSAWLMGELGVEAPTSLAHGKDDPFDAGMSVLAALRGLNREWTLDLHAMPEDQQAGRVLFCGKTHYWWPRREGVG